MCFVKVIMGIGGINKISLSKKRKKLVWFSGRCKGFGGLLGRFGFEF